jgi:hypothetical protein
MTYVRITKEASKQNLIPSNARHSQSTISTAFQCEPTQLFLRNRHLKPPAANRISLSADTPPPFRHNEIETRQTYSDARKGNMVFEKTAERRQDEWHERKEKEVRKRNQK